MSDLNNFSNTALLVHVDKHLPDIDNSKEEFQDLTKTANIAGFRPGKVPLDVVKKQYGDDVKSEVYTRAIEKRFGEFVQKNNIRVAGMPNIEHGSLTNVTDDFEFTATFEVFPDISISDIKKLKVIQYETTVKAEDVVFAKIPSPADAV